MTEEKKGLRRKKHRNSKLGCATCKRRRVKCMEDLPACTNCIKHRVRCEYLDYSEAQLDEFRKAKRLQQMEIESSAEVAEPHILPVVKAEVASEVLETLSLCDSSETKTESMTHLALEVNLHLIMELFDEDDTEEHSKRLADSLMTPPPGTRPTENMMYVPGGLDGELEHNRLHEQGIAHTLEQEHMGIPPHSLDLAQEPAPPDPNTMAQSVSGLHYFPRFRGGVLDVLNFQASSITQNFDNLLATEDRQIIYPVYSIHNTPDNIGMGQTPVMGTFDVQGAFGAQRGLVLKGNTAMTTPMLLQWALPNAIRLGRTFHVPPRSKVNYESLMFQLVGTINNLISEGRASLDDIRQLYHTWLCYFIFKAYNLKVMFLCLTNLTTNYLITNVFLVHDLNRFDTLVLSTRFRNMLVVHLIQHYAIVIKQLLALLNKNDDPEMAASISYILSLMAIYDPEATANSTKCFRDGMFLVLSHTLHLAQKNNVTPPRLIPIHLQLMTNVVRTVYLPAYHPSFLYEYLKMLARFQDVLNDVSKSTITNTATWEFVQLEHNKLAAFCHKMLTSYIPDVDSLLDDIEHQESLFFSMFHLWANLQPSRLLMVRKSSDPLEKVLNLMYRLFRKAVFAVMPQVRFFYLRDFDSPLMLDVFVANKDQDVFGELDYPENLCISPEGYARVQNELKLIAAYAIRVLTFLGMRLAILYRNLVYNDEVRRLYPIKNVVEWRATINDIRQTRDDFHRSIGLLEHSILSFNDTYITALHYPQIVNPKEPGAKLGTPRPPKSDYMGKVDLMSIEPYGLLPLDSMP